MDVRKSDEHFPFRRVDDTQHRSDGHDVVWDEMITPELSILLPAGTTLEARLRDPAGTGDNHSTRKLVLLGADGGKALLLNPAHALDPVEDFQGAAVLQCHRGSRIIQLWGRFRPSPVRDLRFELILWQVWPADFAEVRQAARRLEEYQQMIRRLRLEIALQRCQQ
ncbi:hypothetical protein J2046_004785 [Rhizobium petrolearium]|uniref:hypothetical protein n=1 Tax=Neorhizobium petrolearium TaxID=515361 RepID=UPI001AE874B3|nr:hypothetical protein [Neorhizobium petrolearium]MBP1846508.1 hypothetical protein [Neorhizobium petrolearium]